MEEQSVLDFLTAYIKHLINPRRYIEPVFPSDKTKVIENVVELPVLAEFPPVEESWIEIKPIKSDIHEYVQVSSPIVLVEPEVARQREFTTGFPWRSIIALSLALWAQLLLEPPDPSPKVSIILYSLSAVVLVWAILVKEWKLVPLRDDSPNPLSLQIRPYFFWMSLPLMGFLLIIFGGNRFNPINVFFWVLTFVYVLWSLWIRKESAQRGSIFQRLIGLIRNPTLSIRITPWQILFFVCFILVVFYRFYRLNSVPGEMFSDHAEKLLDVSDVLNGQTSIFFPRNTGREAIQMYLTATIAIILNTGLSFISLKIGTALAGLLTLPFIYRLGKELGNRWVGLLAFVMAGIAYWPNVISRVGLRFPLYPLFVAPMLFYFFRGLRTSNRNDIILAGVALGLGLNGYSPMRIVPFILIILIGFYLLHNQARGKRWETLAALIILGFVALVIFLPLLRYMLDEPDMFGYRALTRLGTTERPFPGAVWQIFLSNLWNAMIMFFWNNGNIWVHSIPNRPALDVVTAALFFIGFILVFFRYVRQRHWADLFLILLVPLLMMPSILSLAFPDENPSLNRTGGAIVPVFIIAAIALESLLAGILKRARSNWGRIPAALIVMALFAGSAYQNFDLVFHQFDQEFMAGAWNTSEIGQVIRAFSDSIGNPESAYVVPFPYWVDTRLVGINAGYPLKDYALWPDKFSSTLTNTGAKLFIIKSDDKKDLELLKTLYPEGVQSLHKASREGKDFYLFFVPMKQPNLP